MSEIFDSAIIEFNLGNYKKALVLFDQVLSAESFHITALIKKGNILGKFAKYTDAITCYDMVLGVEPQNRLALVNKGLALHYLQRYDDAIVCYDMILETKPDSAITLYNKASSLVKKGETKQGLEVLQAAIDVDFSCKYKARTDIDFESIHKTNEFKKLVL